MYFEVLMATFQIAWMGIITGIVGTLINIWYTIADVIEGFQGAFLNLPIIGDICGPICSLIW
jgi:uncharacterized membrane protein